MPHILVVDDHRDTCRLLTRLLQSLGLTATAVPSGSAALELFAASAGDPGPHPSPPRPNVVLLDVMMPGMDGFETLRRLRALPEGKDVPVVMLSALSDDESRERATQLGATDYWVKGAFEFNRFSEMLAPYLPRRFVTLPLVVGKGADVMARDFLALRDRSPQVRHVTTAAPRSASSSVSTASPAT